MTIEVSLDWSEEFRRRVESEPNLHRLNGCALISWLEKHAHGVLDTMLGDEFAWCRANGVTQVHVKRPAPGVRWNDFISNVVLVFGRERDAVIYKMFRC